MSEQKKIKTLENEAEELRRQLYEANETIEAIRTGQVDALIVQKGDMHELYTLQTADHAYRVFIERMTEGAVTLNKDGIILYCNSSFSEMVKRELSLVISSDFREYVAEPIAFEPLLERCMREDCKIETVLVAQKNIIPVQLSFASMDGDHEKVFSVIVTDLTVQKKAQQELEMKNRELKISNSALEMSNRDLLQFASVASHDLQEPVRKIAIFSGFLKESNWNRLDEESKKYLTKIISSSGRMKALIVDMLNYSRLSYSDPQNELISADEVFEEVLEDLEFMIRDRQASVTAGPLIPVYSNKGQLRQVLQNIISNAIKFSKKEDTPVIRVTAKRIAEKDFDSAEDANGKYCLISIRDNGIGFSQEYATGIFELFKRLNSKDAYEGTGIGLAITKKIIEKQGGLISAKSEEDNGAEFLIILPA